MNREAVKAALTSLKQLILGNSYKFDCPRLTVALVFMLVGLVLGGIIGYGLLSCDNIATYVTERDTITYIDTIPYFKPVAKDSMVIKYVTRTLPVKRRDNITTNKSYTFLAENSRTAVLRLHSAEQVEAQLYSRLHEDVASKMTDTLLSENYAQNNVENIRIMRNYGCALQNSTEFGSALAGMEFPPLYASVDSDSAAVAIPITQKRYENEDYRAYVSGYEPNLDSIFVFPKTTVIHERSYKPPNKWHIGITGGYGYGFKSKQAEPYIGIGITYSIISFAF